MLYVYIHTCVYIYIYTCVCVCVYIYIYMYVYIYIYIYIHIMVCYVLLCIWFMLLWLFLFATASRYTTYQSLRLIHNACTPNLPTNIMDFRGFDRNIILILGGGIIMPTENCLESCCQTILVGIMLAGRLGVNDKRACKAMAEWYFSVWHTQPMTDKRTCNYVADGYG